MLRTLSLRLAAVATIVASVVAPSALNAQKALVYCPVGIDAGGCTTIVAALNADATRFPDGADAGYDGTQGTVDLATADFSSYAVFVVPSLADGVDAQPYALLRNGTIAGRLQAAFVGRVAVWSGTPDVGTTNRSSKDALIRNLAAWSKADAAGTHGPGVVALQDNSDDQVTRYGWLGAISALSVTPDTTFDVYSNVQVLTATGQTILTNGGLQLAYTNMASYGLVAGTGGRNDATGSRTSRVVLVTSAGEAGGSPIATVTTDREDYSPGDTVVVTGAGWEPGETVSLLFHEDVDPPIHPDRTLTAVANDNGQILNQEYVIDQDDEGIQFILTATGLTSGREAQTTFTDGNKLQFNTVAFSVAFNVCSPAITVQMLQGNTPENGAPTPVTLSSSSAGGTFYTNSSCTNPPVTSVTIPNSTSLVSFFYKDANTGSPVITAAAGTGCSGGNCTVTQTETITGPDLTITKTHSGSFTAGVQGAYTITVTNSGTATTSGTVTVTDVQPAGLTFGLGSATGTGWTCTGTTTISCSRSNALAAAASYPAITLTATPTAAGTVTNVATVTGGGEANTGNNSASDPTTVLAPVDLTIDKSHTGSFSLGVNGSYTLTVSNGGGVATTGTVTVTDVLPAGLGFVSATGTAWTCGNVTVTVTCTRTTAIAAGTSAPAITLTVSVAAGAFPSVTNTASVGGGGEPAANNGNNSDSDPTTVLAPDLTIDKSHVGNFSQGVNGTYSIDVTNNGGAATTGTVTVTDVLPAGLGFVSGTGGGWSCGVVTVTVTCTRTNSINAGQTAQTIALVVSVGAGAVPSVTNTASVSGGGEPAANNGNNSDSDPTIVGTGVDLTIDKSHTGNFTQGVNGTYTLTVSNPGTVVTSATVTVTDVLPTGLGFVSGTGTGWTNCTVVTQTVTCVRPAANTIAAGGSAPAITLTVTVAAAAVPSVTNTASVAGGGEPAANNGNNSDSDPTTVAAGVDLTIDKSHTGNFTEGVNGSYSIVVSNGGGSATSGTVTVTDVLPTGLGFVSAAGTNWTCGFATGAVTCTTTTAIAGGGSASTITLTVSVAAAAVPSVTNTASAAGGGEPAANNGNNSDSDPTTVIAGNGPPVVEAGGPYTGNEGSAIALNGASATDPDAGDTPIYKWTYVNNGAVDAGTSCSFSNDAIVQPTLTCNDDGAFTLTFKVDDQHGHVVQDNADVTVSNVKPTATAGGPYSGNEGSAITLGGSGDDPAANDDDPKLTYKWTVNTTGIDPGGQCTFDDDTKKDAKITCTDDGAFKVSLVATDDDGAASDASIADLTVANVKPVAHAGGPYSGNEGSDINLTGSATDVGSNDSFTYKWTADVTGIDAGGACTFGNDTHASTTVNCTDNGAFKVRLTVTDDDGESHFEEVALNVANVDPVADAGGDYDGDEGAPVHLYGSASDVGTNDTFTWSWEAVNGPAVDAGATCSFSNMHAQNPTVTCTDDGEFKLTLTVKDDNQGEDSDDALLTLKNVAPVAAAGGPYSGDEGSAIALYGSADDQGDNDDASLTYKWTVNTNGIDPNGTCTFDNDTKKNAKVTCTDDSNGGTFGLSLVATDDDGASSVASTTTLTVANVKPVANAGNAYSGNEGSAIQLSGSADDPGDNDDAHLTYKWTITTTGIDGGGACSFDNDTKKDAKVTCTDDSNGGTFTLSLVATDDDNASSVASTTTLAVANLAPVAAAGTSYSGNEGSAITLSGSADDPGNNDDAHLTYLWTVTPTGIDDGGTCSFDDATKTNAQVTCTDDSNGSTFTLTLVATDDDGASSIGSTATLAVANVKPLVATITKSDGTPLPMTIVVAGTLNIKVPFGDAGNNDTQKAQIDCGEGAGYVNVNSGNNVTTGFLTACTFATIGAKTVKVKVADDDGLYDEKSFGLTVKYTFIGFSAPVDRPNTMNVSKAGQAIPLKWQLLDANGQPITNLTNVDIKINALTCGGNVPTDLIEEYASGASGLKNMGGGNYQFNWKTPTNYAGLCKNIGLDFGSGYVELALANFNFKS